VPKYRLHGVLDADGRHSRSRMTGEVADKAVVGDDVERLRRHERSDSLPPTRRTRRRNYRGTGVTLYSRLREHDGHPTALRPVVVLRPAG